MEQLQLPLQLQPVTHKTESRPTRQDNRQRLGHCLVRDYDDKTVTVEQVDDFLWAPRRLKIRYQDMHGNSDIQHRGDAIVFMSEEEWAVIIVNEGVELCPVT